VDQDHGRVAERLEKTRLGVARVESQLCHDRPIVSYRLG
jgi:hypothetical protein